MWSPQMPLVYAGVPLVRGEHSMGDGTFTYALHKLSRTAGSLLLKHFFAWLRGHALMRSENSTAVAYNNKGVSDPSGVINCMQAGDFTPGW